MDVRYRKFGNEGGGRIRSCAVVILWKIREEKLQG